MDLMVYCNWITTSYTKHCFNLFFVSKLFIIVSPCCTMTLSILLAALLISYFIWSLSLTVLSDSNQAISLLNSEVSTMRKAVLQNCTAPDILTASQGGTCAIIQTECCVFIPDESSNTTCLMNHMKNQISALSDPFPNPDDLLENWFGVGRSWLKYLLITLLTLLAILFVFCLFYKIIVFCITKCVTEPPTKIMMTRRLERVDQIYSSVCDQWL